MEIEQWKGSERISQLLQTLQFESSTTDIDISDLDPDIGEFERVNISKEIELMLGTQYIYIFRKNREGSGRTQIGRLEIDGAGVVVQFVPDVSLKELGEALDILAPVHFFSTIERNFKIQSTLLASSARAGIKKLGSAEVQRSCEVTNESIDAIVESLNPNESDRILSICGTGDVPLAFLERGCSVDAIDLDSEIIDLAKENLALLEEGEWRKFLAAEMPGFETESMNRRLHFIQDLEPQVSTLDFFRDSIGDIDEIGEPEIRRMSLSSDWDRLDHSQSETLRRIVANKDKVDFQEKSILEALSEKKYTKVWLSNIIGYKEQNFNFTAKLFLALSESLDSGGEFYTTNGNLTEQYLNRAYDEEIIPRGTFKLDKEKTALAQKLQVRDLRGVKHQYTWKPSVYVRQ